jgi:hypothetical protein
MSSTPQNRRNASEPNVRKGPFHRISGKVRRASERLLAPSRSGPPSSPHLPNATVGELRVPPPSTAAQPPSPSAVHQHIQPFSPSEIHEHTAGFLKQRLGPVEWGKLKWDEYTGTTAEQAKAVVEEVRYSMDGRREHTEKMYKTLQHVNKYCAIVDVAIQHQPQITALVWAGARMVIQVRTLIP